MRQRPKSLPNLTKNQPKLRLNLKKLRKRRLRWHLPRKRRRKYRQVRTLKPKLSKKHLRLKELNLKLRKIEIYYERNYSNYLGFRPCKVTLYEFSIQNFILILHLDLSKICL